MRDTHHALGVFHLTQQNYTDAIKEFESALKFANQNARIHNDLGVAYFELAKTGPSEKKARRSGAQPRRVYESNGTRRQFAGGAFQ